MGKVTCLVVVVALAIAPTSGRAQTTATGDRPASDALVVEMRLLRQAVERLTVLAVRDRKSVV